VGALLLMANLALVELVRAVRRRSAARPEQPVELRQLTSSRAAA
jgi:hypothetical protein